MYNTHHNQSKGNKMLEIGQTFTTAKSGVVGTIKEIVANPNGTQRLLLDVNGKDRWTTA